MKKTLLSISIFLIGLLIMGGCSAKVRNESEVTKKFSGISKIEITTISGDCKIIKHDKPTVELKLSHEYKPAKTFNPIFEQHENILKLREDMTGSNSGSSLWVLMVPEKMDVKFNSASGGILLTNITGRIKINTASGNINASGIKLTGPSNFSTASGKSTVSLRESLAHDILVNSASGMAKLDFGGVDIKGTIEMKCRPSIGKIDCSLRLTDENVIDHHGQEYIIKSLMLEKESPNIRVHTASGQAIIKV